MSAVSVCFAGAQLDARPSGALWWPAQRTLIAADLHLGKSERIARRGGALLPPFETRDTLRRLTAEVQALRPARLILLGDVFDDLPARDALDADERALWDGLTQGRARDIVAGNHDPGALSELVLDGIALRHIAGGGPDISGHFHPKTRLAGVARPAFVIGADHVILPAFGTYTGGLWVTDPALAALVPEGIAVLTGTRALAVPLGMAAGTGGSRLRRE